MTDAPTPQDGRAAEREVLTGQVLPAPGDDGAGGSPDTAGPGDPGPGAPGRRTAAMVAGDLAGTAAGRARQVSELLSGTTRLVAGVLGASGVVGALGALLVTGLLAVGFDWTGGTAAVVLVVLLLPAIEVVVHRSLLLRAFGDPAGLRKRFTDLPDATVGRVQEFTGRVRGMRSGTGPRAGRVFGAARSAHALRGLTEVLPELTGALLLPLSRALLLVTAVCAAICWVLLLVTPVAAVVGLVGAVAG